MLWSKNARGLLYSPSLFLPISPYFSIIFCGHAHLGSFFFWLFGFGIGFPCFFAVSIHNIIAVSASLSASSA
jgi:hypothetical protein